ncbi:MAG: hypothetical protein ACPF9I_06685 [Candidatus Thalassarchaeaceae archaeon]
MSDMTEGFDILSKMDPMARRALASMEAMTKAIELNNRDDIEKHLSSARNALDILTRDLNLHDSLVKNVPQSDFSQVGIIRKFDNSESSINQADGAVALGVVRAGRSDRIYRPHNVV